MSVTAFFVKKWPKSFTIVPYSGPLLENFAEKRVIVPYRGPLLVPYSRPFLVPYNGTPLYNVMNKQNLLWFHQADLFAQEIRPRMIND